MALVVWVGMVTAALWVVLIAVTTSKSTDMLEPDRFRVRAVVWAIGAVEVVVACAVTAFFLRMRARSPFYGLTRAQRLAAVAVLHGSATSDDPLVQQAATRLASAGSRMRPARDIAICAGVGIFGATLAVVTYGAWWWLLVGLLAVQLVAVARLQRRKVTVAQRFLASARVRERRPTPPTTSCPVSST